MPDLPSDYELVIRPSRGWFHLDLPEVWRYRDLLFLLIYREFIAKYKQTILGPAWFILQPLLTTIVFTVVFGTVAGIPTDGLPPLLFYQAGLLGWSFFAQTFQSVSSTLITNAGLFGKVYFPRLVVPLSVVLSNFMALALQFATFLVFWAYFKFLTPAGGTIVLSAAVIWLPLLLIQLGALSLGVGLWLSAVTAKYRDLTFLTGFIIQLWLYATPVIYSLSQVPERWRWVAVLNPMTMPVELVRYMLLGRGVSLPLYETISVAMTATLLLTGTLAFNKTEKTFVDTV